jgi:hypothetical protein
MVTRRVKLMVEQLVIDPVYGDELCINHPPRHIVQLRHRQRSFDQNAIDRFPPLAAARDRIAFIRIGAARCKIDTASKVQTQGIDHQFYKLDIPKGGEQARPDMKEHPVSCRPPQNPSSLSLCGIQDFCIAPKRWPPTRPLPNRRPRCSVGRPFRVTQIDHRGRRTRRNPRSHFDRRSPAAS